MDAPEFVFKIFLPDQWKVLETSGVFHGSADDLRDGFIHLSCAHQLEGTIAKHFAAQTRLMIATFSGKIEGLQMEVSRGGAKFPHLYGVLRRTDVVEMNEWSPGDGHKC